MRERKRTFLEQEEWIRIPWSLHSDRTEAYNECLDIACSIPGILEDLDAITSIALQTSASSQHAVLSRIRTVREHAYQKFSALEVWREKWEFPDLDDNDCEEYYGVTEDYPQEILGPALDFPNLTACNAYVFYLGALYNLCEALQPQFSGNLPQSWQDESFSLKRPARGICRCLPYLLDLSQHASAGGVIGQHAAGDIISAFDHDSAEFKWIIRSFQIFPQKMGIEGGKPFLIQQFGESRVEELFAANPIEEEV